MFRVLRRPSWIGLTVLVVVLAITFVELGRWQLRRHDERAATNLRVEASLDRASVPVDEILAVDERLPLADEWRLVEVVGTYDADNELLVRNRPYDGNVGYEVLTPLVTHDGRALLVDRGWVPAGSTATEVPAVPPPPPGEVTVTARVRAGSTGDAGAAGLPDGQVRRVAVASIAPGLPYPVYGAYTTLLPGQPGSGVAEDPPRAIPVPEPSAGPHVAYAVQWFLFALIAVGGWVVLLRADVRAAGPARPRPVGRAPPDGAARPPPGRVRA